MIIFPVENPTTTRLQWWERRRTWLSIWLASAGAAGGLALVSTLPGHRAWGLCALVGYLLAAGAAALMPRRGARTAAVVLAFVGAAAVPLFAFAALGVGQSEVGVIERSARLFVDTGSPYLADPTRVGDYNPYLPGMALFGLPRVLLGDDGRCAMVLGDARVWCAAVFVGCLAAGRTLLRPTSTSGRAPYGLLGTALVASPVVALSWSVSGVDLPLTGLTCLALAAAARGRSRTAGAALAVACALKWVIWPAL
ncbi:hypothetical protein GT354_30580, partial [Streptomyces sp. SID3343]|nr:hypothetical protein [Streptomyces sp. SID3343]